MVDAQMVQGIVEQVIGGLQQELVEVQKQITELASKQFDKKCFHGCSRFIAQQMDLMMNESGKCCHQNYATMLF